MIDLSQIPLPAERNIALHLKAAAERAVREGHPWLYENSIEQQSREGKAGDIAICFDHKRRFLAAGFYDPASPIRVKLLQHGQAAKIDKDYFRQKLEKAAALRSPLLSTDTNAFRLVHGENDGLPALIIDKYADVLVIKIYSAIWFAHLREFLAALEETNPAPIWLLRLGRNVQEGECFGLKDGMLLKGELPDSNVLFRENGLKFRADVVHGHKTGFFFDQRENRQRLRNLAKGKTVLDVFSYNGGFAVYAAAGGAKQVTSVDISAPALESAKANFALNLDNPNLAACEFKTIAQDAFEVFETLHPIYDLVIVDPPSFANSQEQVAGALRAYEKLTLAALKIVKKNGILVMASCSSRVTSDAFFDVVTRTARNSYRPLQEIERTTHAIDHPIGFPEGAYLKALFATVP
jgi:23S rRNA (cytosine1962-C5)-methyltransferase